MKNGRPLLCWDIFMEGFHRRLNLADDIQQLAQLSQQQGWIHNLNFEHQLLWLDRTILVTDPALMIVYASSNMENMNGYTPDEVIGWRPSMFQGPETSLLTRQQLGEAIKKQTPFETTIINYRKDGQQYLCHLEEYPLFNHKKDLVNFIAFEHRT